MLANDTMACLLLGLQYRAYVSTWHMSVHGMCQYIACVTTWHVSVHGMCQYMACVTTWHVSVHGMCQYRLHQCILSCRWLRQSVLIDTDYTLLGVSDRLQ